MALAGKQGAVFVQTSAAPAAFTNEATTGNALYTRYTINAATKRYWDPSAAVTVKKNGSTITTGFAIEYAGGVIVFAVPLINTDVITVSGSFLTVAEVGGFFNWSLDMSADMMDTTAFGDSAKSFTPGMIEWSGSAEAYWGDEKFFTALGTTVVIVLYVDKVTTLARYEGFAVISGDGIEAALDDVIKDSIDFQGTGALYYRP